MSRRAKLIILALFLVLLGIPVVYCALMWSPANPLRFRPVCFEYDDQPYPALERYFIARMEVENTSLAEVHLWSAEISSAHPTSLGADVGGAHPGLTIWNGEVKQLTRWTIPPRSTMHCITFALNSRHPTLCNGTAHVSYRWSSDLRYRTVAWLRQWLPTQLRPGLPHGDDEYDVIRLELPSNTGAP